MSKANGAVRLRACENGRCLLVVFSIIILILIFMPTLKGIVQASPGDVVLCSSDSSGQQGNRDSSWGYSMSADGRYVVFSSQSDNIISGDSNMNPDVFRKDLQTGETILCSCDADGNQVDNGYYPSISADGRYIAFVSTSPKLVPGFDSDGNPAIYRKDLQTGEVLPVSIGGPCSASGIYDIPTISADGRFVAFVDRTGFNPYDQYKKIYRKDLNTGEVVLCSCDASGQEGNRYSDYPSISDDGRYVAFISWASSFASGDTNGTLDVYRKDLQTGDILLCSCDNSGIVGDAGSNEPSISSEGRFVVFSSGASNLVPGVTSGDQVYRKDLQTGEVVLCSCDPSGDEGNSSSTSGSISADGRYVTLDSYATDLVPGSSGEEQVYRKDLQTGEIVLCSCDPSGDEANDISRGGTLSADGKYVAFASGATNLVPGVSGNNQIFRKEVPPAKPHTYRYYFADGCTLQGFQEYLCLGTTANMPIVIEVSYHFAAGNMVEKSYDLLPRSRLTVNVNAEVGGGREVSIIAESSHNFIAERPMYFDYTASGDSWSGGHISSGVNMTSATWYFAEGYTGPGFDEWICVLNPGNEKAELEFNFQTEEEGEKVVNGLSVMPHSRCTYKANDLLGGFYQTSLMLVSDEPVVAERSMYFDYQGTAGWSWKGGHCVAGAPDLCSGYYFAEGTTRSGFEEWLTLQNPWSEDISIYANYYSFREGNIHAEYTVPAGRRFTVFVPSEVGAEKDVSIHLWSLSPFLAERPMYFDYRGYAEHSRTGGHCVIGATALQEKWFFAEGYTGFGFEEWICLQNTDNYDTEVNITYFPEKGPPINRRHTVPANSRYTVFVNEDIGPGQAVCTEVVSELPIVAERPMYFDYNGWDGGHDTVGLTP